MVEIDSYRDSDSMAIEALLDLTFGRERTQRSAYHIRRAASYIPALSCTAHAHLGTAESTDADREQTVHAQTVHARLAKNAKKRILLGSIQCWSLAHVSESTVTPLIMVGPVAVHPAYRGAQIGQKLVRSVLDKAAHHADGALMMIGDPGYYQRFFGFAAHWTRDWQLDYPVETHRLLARAIGAHSPPTERGYIVPRPVLDAKVAC